MENKKGYGFDIEKVYKRYLEELDKKYQIYKKAEKDPELILTEMYKGKTRYPSNYTLMTDVLDYGDIGVHDFKESLANVLNEYFKSIDSEIELRTSRGGFPNYYFIEYKEHEIIRFSIFRHVYEIRGIEKRIKNNKYNIGEIDKNIREIEEEIEKFIKGKERPRTLINKNVRKSLKEKINEQMILLFYSKKIRDGVEDLIVKRKKWLVDEIALKETYEEKLELLETSKKEVKEKERYWKEKFLNWGYTEQKDVYS